MDWRCCHEKIGAHEAKHGEEKDDVPGEFLDEVWDEKGSAEASRNEGKHLGGDSEGMGVASDIMEEEGEVKQIRSETHPAQP